MKSFITGLGSEFGKIVWPAWAEAVGHAVLVIVVAVVVGYYLGLLDGVFAGAVKALIG